MIREILTYSNIAIIGGGRVCKAILEIILGENFRGKEMKIVGVADINERAEGFVYAREKGLYTTTEYRDLFQIQGLDVIIELTGDDKVLEELKATRPAEVRLIDHFEAMSVWDYLQIEDERARITKDLPMEITSCLIVAGFPYGFKNSFSTASSGVENLDFVKKLPVVLLLGPKYL